MAPKEDLNLPEGDQNEAKDAESSVETVEPTAGAGTNEEESGIAPEINLVTEKGTTSMEEAPKSETKNIAAEISALLDASDENEKVLETEEDAIPSASVTLRKRLTKGTSEEENPGRRGSCFLTEIDENADDEVFNPEEAVKNIEDIDNYLERKENPEQQTNISLEKAATSMDEIEDIGMLEDDNIMPSKLELRDITDSDVSLTEPIVLTIEEKPCEEPHTPASIVDTILAAARRSASVEQSPPDVIDETQNEENTKSLTVDTENTVTTDTAELSEEIACTTEKSKKDDVPIELLEAATTIVDTIIEKAKLVVIEGAEKSTGTEVEKDMKEDKVEDTQTSEQATTIVDTIIEKAKLVVSDEAGQSKGSEVEIDVKEDKAEDTQTSEQEKDTQMAKDIAITSDSVEEKIAITADNENEAPAPIEETCEEPTKVPVSTTIEYSVPTEEETHEAPVSVGDTVENTIKEELTEDQTCVEGVNMYPVQSEELVEENSTENPVLIEEKVKDPMLNEKEVADDLVNEDVKTVDTVIEATTAETDVIQEIYVEPTTDALQEEALNTTDVEELIDNRQPSQEDYVEATMKEPIETTESHFKANEFIDDIKKEFNDVFVDSELMDNSQGNTVTSTDKPRNILDSLPLGELALATLVIFLALILFNN